MALLLAGTVTLSACGSTGRPPPVPVPSPREFASLPADERPTPAGRGPGFRLSAVSARVAAHLSVAGMRCQAEPGPAGQAHLELYADRLVLPVPAGIGVGPPQQRQGAYVRGGACLYPLRTREPTGLVVLGRAGPPGRPARYRLADLFALWGQPLGRRRLAGFRGAVIAYRNGHLFSGEPGAIPLGEHDQIVVEVGGLVLAHRRYRFPPSAPGG